MIDTNTIITSTQFYNISPHEILFISINREILPFSFTILNKNGNMHISLKHSNTVSLEIAVGGGVGCSHGIRRQL